MAQSAVVRDYRALKIGRRPSSRLVLTVAGRKEGHTADSHTTEIATVELLTPSPGPMLGEATLPSSFEKCRGHRGGSSQPEVMCSLEAFNCAIKIAH